MDTATARLDDVIAEESQRSVEPPAMAVAEAIRRRHGGVVAVLFYGSCLRDGTGTTDADAGVLDFYVLVDRYRDAYSGWLAAAANAILPPNVFYVEIPWRERLLRAKYAVMTLDQFRRGTSARSFQSSLWARFCQPVRLVHASDAEVRAAVVAALRDAVVTMVRHVAPLLDDDFTAEALWTRGFRETYRAELRVEGPARARLVYEADRERYDRVTPLALKAAGPARRHGARRRARAAWALRRVAGKLLNLLRLIKCGFTYDGAMDYVLWKIERHCGVRPPVTPWQRRHPLLAAPVVVWRLFRLGAFR